MEATLEQIATSELLGGQDKYGAADERSVIYLLKRSPSPALQKLGGALAKDSQKPSAYVDGYSDNSGYDHTDTHADND